MSKPLHEQPEFLDEAIHFTLIGVCEARKRLNAWNYDHPGPKGEMGRQGRQATLDKGLRLLRHLHRLKGRVARPPGIEPGPVV